MAETKIAKPSLASLAVRREERQSNFYFDRGFTVRMTDFLLDAEKGREGERERGRRGECGKGRRGDSESRLAVSFSPPPPLSLSPRHNGARIIGDG